MKKNLVLEGLEAAVEHAKLHSAARRLGSKGGKARAEKLSAKERSDIARKAAVARWGKK